MEINSLLNAEKIVCKRCGFEIGKIIDEHLWLVSGLILSEAHGVCVQCGFPFHYAVTERQLQRLLERVIVSRNTECAVIESK
jgi:ribosomal protein L37E